MNEDVQHPILKAVGAVGLTLAGHSLADWAQLAGLISTCLASIYCACLISEWMWKRIVRPWGRRLGLIKHPEFVNSTVRGDL